MISLAVAYLAPIINCVYQIPQLFKTIQTKRVKDISLFGLSLLLLNNILWLIHGHFIDDTPLIISTVLSLTINIPLAYFFLKYRHNR